MPPKKKGNKKGNDDWEAELGEAVDPIATATQEAKSVEAAENGEADEIGAGGGGGLLAALKKNKSKKQKKGKVVEEDYLDGEDPPTENDINGTGTTDGTKGLAAKAPEEATTDDLFAAPVTKVKGGKGKQAKAEEEPTREAGASDEEGGTLKSKKEKEKEKKEREKQRKKEQVIEIFQSVGLAKANLVIVIYVGC